MQVQTFNVLCVSKIHSINGDSEWHIPIHGTLELITKQENQHGALVPKLVARFGGVEHKVEKIGVGLHGSCLAVFIRPPTKDPDGVVGCPLVWKLYTDTPSQEGRWTEEDVRRIAQEEIEKHVVPNNPYSQSLRWARSIEEELPVRSWYWFKREELTTY